MEKNTEALSKIDRKLQKTARIRSRIWELDFLRGLCILLMIFDHFFVAVSTFFGPDWVMTGNEALISFVAFSDAFFEGSLRMWAQPLIVFLFYFLCGISCIFSRNNARRGVEMGLAALLITVFTHIFDMTIWFGTVHMLACSVLIWSFIHLCCRKQPEITAFVCLLAGTLIVFAGVWLDQSAIHMSGDFWSFVHDRLAGPTFYSADYYPLIPYSGFVLLGAGLGYFVYGKRKRSLLPALQSPRWYRPVNFIGRKGIWVYLFHQLIISGLFALISFIWLTPGDWILF